MKFQNKFLSKFLRKLSLILTKYSERLFNTSLKLYPYTSLNELDHKIANLLPELLKTDTFFLEVGANDGIKQSNTYFLESIFDAKGILIEASASNFEKLIINRSKKNIFEHCALVSSDYDKSYLEFIFSDLMTVCIDSKNVNSYDHAKRGLKFFKGINYNFLAPAKTLSEILEKHNIRKIDFMSIDLEGSELDALKGIDLNCFDIRNILIEARDIKSIKNHLGIYNYFLREKLSNHDYLFCKNIIN